MHPLDGLKWMNNALSDNEMGFIGDSINEPLVSLIIVGRKKTKNSINPSIASFS
jgi:hypothetical protein